MVVGVEVERRKKSDDTRTKKEEKMIAKQQQRIPGGFRAKPDQVYDRTPKEPRSKQLCKAFFLSAQTELIVNNQNTKKLFFSFALRLLRVNNFLFSSSASSAQLTSNV